MRDRRRDIARDGELGFDRERAARGVQRGEEGTTSVDRQHEGISRRRTQHAERSDDRAMFAREEDFELLVEALHVVRSGDLGTFDHNELAGRNLRCHVDIGGRAAMKGAIAAANVGGWDGGGVGHVDGGDAVGEVIRRRSRKAKFGHLRS